MQFFSHIWTIQNSWQFITALVVSTVLFVALMFALHQLAPQAKKWMVIICTFVAGLYFVLEYFIPATVKGPGGEMQNFITPSIQPVSDFVTVIFGWLFGLGVISLLVVHGRKLFKRLPGWHDSLAFFLSFIGILVVGFWTQMGHVGKAGLITAYNTLYFGLLVNLDSAMFALLAFYIASAAYRAFRVRTLESALLMITALIIMLGMVDVGLEITHNISMQSPWSFFRIEVFSQWILNWINMPASRAVLVGVMVGSLAMAMRLWLSLERGAFFSQE